MVLPPGDVEVRREPRDDPGRDVQGLQTLGQGLTKLGYTVDLAGDGENGLALAETHEYHVIVLDPILPGLEVLRRLLTRAGARMSYRFWRKDETRTGGRNAGLGLALVRALADLLEIEARLHPDRTFRITLSRAKTSPHRASEAVGGRGLGRRPKPHDA